jgi:beta-N-acetylhexosaminidase
MTDDLDMGAIIKNFNIKTAMRQILAADIDMALVCHKGPNIQLTYEEIDEQLRCSPEIKSMGIESVRRILALKEKYIEI